MNYIKKLFSVFKGKKSLKPLLKMDDAHNESILSSPKEPELSLQDLQKIQQILETDREGRLMPFRL